MDSIKSAINTITSSLTGSTTSQDSAQSQSPSTNTNTSDANLVKQMQDKLNIGESSDNVPSVESEINAASKDATPEARQQHDTLLKTIEKEVDRAEPVSTSSEAVGDQDFVAQATGVAADNDKSKDDAPSVAEEIRSAAPKADPESIQAHTLLVSEIESVVPKEQSKPVHEIVETMKPVEEPKEIAAISDASAAANSAKQTSSAGSA